MPTPRCHILIAAGDPAFSNRLKSHIRMIATDNSYFSIVISEAATTDDLEKEFHTNTSILFMDAGFFAKEDKHLSRILKRTNPDCIFTLLLSDNSGETLEKAIPQLEKQKTLPLSVHILKNNYPDQLIKNVVARMVDLAWGQKQTAMA